MFGNGQYITPKTLEMKISHEYISTSIISQLAKIVIAPEAVKGMMACAIWPLCPHSLQVLAAQQIQWILLWIIWRSCPAQIIALYIHLSLHSHLN